MLEPARKDGAPLPSRGQPFGIESVWDGMSTAAKSDDGTPAVSFSLNVTNYRNTNPRATLSFRKATVYGTMVSLQTHNEGCARLEYTMTQSGWYVISMTAVTYGPVTVEARGPYGGVWDTFSFSKSGYTDQQFPRLAYFSGSNTFSVTSWCPTRGDFLFASVHVHSM